MKLREIMTGNVVRIGPEEPVEVAARAFAHYNIGALPVCTGDGRLCGVITDRDVVTRCIAAGRSTGTTKVKEIMTGRVISAGSDMEVGVAAHLMGREQIRRLPVVENGKLCGMVSLADMAAHEENIMDAADALEGISSNISSR